MLGRIQLGMLFCYEMTAMKKGTEKRDGSIFLQGRGRLIKLG
jgi:hypothetical protein